jgi:hypothetical protein
MATTHPDATRDAATNAVVDRADLGSAEDTATLRIKTAANAVLADLPMSNPAFGDSASGVAAAAAIATTAAAAGGIAAKYDVLNRDGAVVFSGSVTATGGGGDLILNNTNIAEGQDVEITSFTYTALAQ